ncbi:MAG: AAA family ATPase [Candidatus Woesearchaeota archaeon]
MIIAVTGTPGTGKTTLAKKLAKRLGYKLFDVNKFLDENKSAISGFDYNRDSKIIDVNKLTKDIKRFIKENDIRDIVIDSHMSHILPKNIVDLVIVARTNLKVLKKRLEKRKYSKEKVRENLDSEIFEICLNETIEKKHKFIQIDTTNNIDRSHLSEIVKFMGILHKTYK